MKKSVLLLVMAAASLLLFGCNRNTYELDYECSQDYKGATLRILNWGEYLDQGLIEEFEKLCNVKVVYEEVDSNETMQTRLKNGDTDYDILVPSDYMIERLYLEGELETINFDNIPNYQYIEDELKGREHDPNDEYSVPYFWGTVGLMYNKELLAELNIKESELNSWSILKDQRLKDQTLLYNSARDLFMVGFKLVDPDLSINVTDETEYEYEQNIERAINELKVVQNLAQKYGTDDIKGLIVNGDAAVGLVYSGDYLEMYYDLEDEANDLIGYVIPEEGSNMWFDSFVITKKTNNKRLAEEFINFMCDPKVAYYNAIYVGYTTANGGAIELLAEDEDYKDVLNLEAYRPAALDKLEVYRDLGVNLNNKLNQAFDQLRG